MELLAVGSLSDPRSAGIDRPEAGMTDFDRRSRFLGEAFGLDQRLEQIAVTAAEFDDARLPEPQDVIRSPSAAS